MARLPTGCLETRWMPTGLGGVRGRSNERDFSHYITATTV